MIDLRCGDCLEVMRGMAPDSIDAVVTDPPAGIAFMGKDWDKNKGGRDVWIEWLAVRMKEARRVARPGAHALVWALPRTSHWTATAMEDAGWAVDDRITHHFGQGFPKHKSKLKPATEDWWLCTKPGGAKWLNVDGCRIAGDEDGSRNRPPSRLGSETTYAQDEWTKNAVVTRQDTTGKGRWPANVVLSHHPDCVPIGTKRVKGTGHRTTGGPVTRASTENWRYRDRQCHTFSDSEGMETLPAWECVEGCPVAELDRQSGTLESGKLLPHHTDNGKGHGCLGAFRGMTGRELYGDSGGASRFFYCSKASRDDRGDGNTHPTVKSTELMRYLCRLITPAGGTILDPFMGSGSTLKAAIMEGFGAIGIESDEGYFKIAEARIAAEIARTPLFAS